MATVAKIRCFSCKNSFEHYCNTPGGGGIACPFCYAVLPSNIAQQMRYSMIIHAEDNRSLREYSGNGTGTPLFQFDLLEVGKK